jgi:protein-S-isoprenylcysteine O-methyltransferase Ste14
MAKLFERSLALRSTVGLVRLLVLQAAVLCAAAGTASYWQAWLYLALQALINGGTNVYLLRHDRALLTRRLAIEEVGEKERVHQLFFTFLRVSGLVLLAIAGLDRRYGWSTPAPAAVLTSCAIYILASALLFWVLRENSFASSVIEVATEQTVVATGPYRLVRHPMYTGFLLGIAATPIALGSYWAALVLPPVCALFVIRLRAEERTLASELPGYAAYLRATPKRLLPGVW